MRKIKRLKIKTGLLFIMFDWVPDLFSEYFARIYKKRAGQ